MSAPGVQQRPGLYWLVGDTWQLFTRTLIQIWRTPAQLVTLVVLQPVMLIILFRYVFGGAVVTGEASYADFLIPGVFATNAVLVATIATVSIAGDLTSGTVDRFRTLPMSRSAILGGTILANALRSLAALVAMVLIGLLVGFRPDAGPGGWLAAIGLLLLVSYAFSWALGVLGIVAGSPEAAQQLTALVWPFTFVSSAFVPADSMPGWLGTFAAEQPMTHAIDATRALLLGHPVEDHAWITVVWCLGITAVSILLAQILFRRRFG